MISKLARSVLGVNRINNYMLYIAGGIPKRTVVNGSETGQSPAPSITWVRKGDGQPLPAKLVPAPDREGETVSMVTILPSKEDDGSEYQCEVSSRALPPMGVLTQAVNISVNCKFNWS